VSRVIAIGLDAVEADLVTRLMSEGRLPNLARLRARASSVTLESDSDYCAESPWTEFVTGRRPSTLRYWTTVTFDPDAIDAYMRGAPDTEPFYAFDRDATVVTFDVPKVVRSPRVNGVQILGWGAHSIQYPAGSRPAGELAAVHARFGPHPGLALEYAGGWNQPEYLVAFGRRQATAIRRRGEILRWLAARAPEWDLLLMLVGETHQLGHVTAHGFGGRFGDAPTAGVAKRAMEAAVLAADDLVGDIVGWAPDDATIVLFSVHGIHTSDDGAAAALLPEMLYRRGTGQHRLPPRDLTAWRHRGGRPIVPPRWQSPFAWTVRNFPGREPLSIASTARAYTGHVLRRWAPAVLDARRRLRGGEPGPTTAPEEPVTLPLDDHSMDYWHPATFYRDAWQRMPAFVIPGYSDAQIRINLAGRERGGLVARDDYTQACDEIEEFLRDLRNGATGAPVVREIHRVREDDPETPDGPPADLVVQLDDADALDHPEVGAVGPIVATRTGGHSTTGFADIAGPGVTPGALGTARVCDLSATIVALLGARSVVPLDGRSFLDPVESR